MLAYQGYPHARTTRPSSGGTYSPKAVPERGDMGTVHFQFTACLINRPTVAQSGGDVRRHTPDEYYAISLASVLIY